MAQPTHGHKWISGVGWLLGNHYWPTYQTTLPEQLPLHPWNSQCRSSSLYTPHCRPGQQRTESRTLEYMDVPHSLHKCNISLLGQSCWTSKYSPVHGAWHRFSVIVLLVLCYALCSTPWQYRKHNQKISGAPSSYYFCQNEILYNERVNGLLSKIFFNILQTFFLCIHCEAENLSTLHQ
jgi:hypothetical protein